jgi:hypothetical protein
VCGKRGGGEPCFVCACDVCVTHVDVGSGLPVVSVCMSCLRGKRWRDAGRVLLGRPGWPLSASIPSTHPPSNVLAPLRCRRTNPHPLSPLECSALAPCPTLIAFPAFKQWCHRQRCRGHVLLLPLPLRARLDWCRRLTTVRQYLELNSDIMDEVPPLELAERYSG